MTACSLYADEAEKSRIPGYDTTTSAVEVLERSAPNGLAKPIDAAQAPIAQPVSGSSAGDAARDHEAALIMRARTGDEQAFAELVNRHRAAVWAACLRITGNRDDAEDALQDALMSAWQNIGRFRGESRFSTWLFRIASNAALAVVRRRPQFVELLEDHPTPWRDPAERIDDARRVHEALLRIPEAFRVALVLRVYGDFTYQDIAVHQGIPVQTVKSRISRARRIVEQFLTAAQPQP